MMKYSLAAFFALSTSVSAFTSPLPSQSTHRRLGSLQAVAGAAKDRAEDLELTLKIIMDHAARSTTASKDQFISEMEQQTQDEADAEPVDITIPYDAPAALAYEQAGSPGDYEAFKTQFEADAVADVIAKNTPPLDISVPYDAAAKLAFEKAGSKGDYNAFKTQYEADAVAAVMAKQAPAPAASAVDSSSSDISVPYDAPARLAYEKAGSPGDYAEFKAQYEAQAVAEVTAKQQKAQEPVTA